MKKLLKKTIFKTMEYIFHILWLIGKPRPNTHTVARWRGDWLFVYNSKHANYHSFRLGKLSYAQADTFTAIGWNYKSFLSTSYMEE